MVLLGARPRMRRTKASAESSWGMTRTYALGAALRPSAGAQSNIGQLPLKVAVGTAGLMGRY